MRGNPVRRAGTKWKRVAAIEHIADELGCGRQLIRIRLLEKSFGQIDKTTTPGIEQPHLAGIEAV